MCTRVVTDVKLLDRSKLRKFDEGVDVKLLKGVIHLAFRYYNISMRSWAELRRRIVHIRKQKSLRFRWAIMAFITSISMSTCAHFTKE